MLLLSGGVSAGKLDLVPAALAAVGVRQVFHKVKVKPGQPLWFGVAGEKGLGTRDKGQGTNDKEQSILHPPSSIRSPHCCVFGLPGNPVSSMVCFELFARTAIRRLMGIEPAEPVPLRARLQSD